MVQPELDKVSLFRNGIMFKYADMVIVCKAINAYEPISSVLKDDYDRDLHTTYSMPFNAYRKRPKTQASTTTEAIKAIAKWIRRKRKKTPAAARQVAEHREIPNASDSSTRIPEKLIVKI